MSVALDGLIDRMIRGEQGALARLITLVEEEGQELAEVMRRADPYTGRAYCVGITGPPGAGKSTVVDKLTAQMRLRGLAVGIVAVDPSSPFSGGAILGDRIRMQQHYLDPGVFIRSMATRGSQGGLPSTIGHVVKLLDASGKDLILVETVGVGQTELDVIRTADAVVVVLTPESGDAVQALKAGLTEIADVFVINKADREGAQRMKVELEAVLSMKPTPPPVLTAQAAHNIGIEELYLELERHRQTMEKAGEIERRHRQRRKEEFVELVQRKLRQRFLGLLEEDEELKALAAQVMAGEVDPYSASLQVLSGGRSLRKWLGPGD